MSKRATPRTPSLLRLAAWGAVLVLYGNVVNGLERSWGRDLAGPSFYFALPVMWAILMAARRWEGLTWRDIGLHAQGAAAKAALGVVIGLAMGVAAVTIIRFQPVSPQDVTYAPLASASWTDLATRILVTMPVDTVLLEEVAFRGALLALFLRRFRAVGAVALSSAVFMLWHVAINYATVLQTSWAGDGVLLALGLAAAYVAVLAAGVFFCALRLWTGSLAAPITAHWAVNATILVGMSM